MSAGGRPALRLAIVGCPEIGPKRLPPPPPPAARRYEKYDSLGAAREKTDDPFLDELNMVQDKVQDMQLVRGVLPASVVEGRGSAGSLEPQLAAAG